MSIIDEFKTFIMRGNVMDLAVGVIIGGAFGTIVKSLPDDVIMPIVGMFGSADFTNFVIPLSSSVTATTLEAAREQGAVLAYGSFITAIINFLILGFIIFMMIKAVNRLLAKKAEEPAAPPAPTPDQTLLAEIRDLLAGAGPAAPAPAAKAASRKAAPKNG